MKDIDKMLQNAINEEIKIPTKVKYKIQYALNNVDKQKNNKIREEIYKMRNGFMKKLVTAMTSIFITLIGGVTVYAAFGGTIQGVPIVDWFGIKLSSEYENYKINVDGKEFVNGETKVNLVSTVCDEGITILEFDVKLSKEDKENLHIGEYVVTDEYINDETNNPNIVMEYNGEKLTPQEIKNKIVQDNQGKKIELCLSLNEGFSTDINGKQYIQGSYNNFKVIIDDEEFWIRPRAYQSVNQISDYEYKIYQMYFLTEKEIAEKTDFKITVDDIILTSRLVQLGEEAVYITIDGAIEVEVSKSKALKETKNVKIESSTINYDYRNIKVDKVMVTPLQTIVKIKNTISNVSQDNLNDVQSDSYIGDMVYKVYDQEGKKLNSDSFEMYRKITYSDGTVEEWASGDIGNDKEFKNATLEITDYIVIEKVKDTNMITMKPIIEKNNNTIELDEFEFSLID